MEERRLVCHEKFYPWRTKTVARKDEEEEEGGPVASNSNPSQEKEKENATAWKYDDDEGCGKEGRGRERDKLLSQVLKRPLRPTNGNVNGSGGMVDRVAVSRETEGGGGGGGGCDDNNTRRREEQKDLKAAIKKARQVGDQLGEGRSLVRLAEMKLARQLIDATRNGSEEETNQTNKPSSNASSYAFRGTLALFKGGSTAEGLEGLRLYARAKEQEARKNGYKRSKYFLAYQSCSLSLEDRACIEKDMVIFTGFTRIMQKLGSKLGEITTLAEVQKSYLRSKFEPRIVEFIFYDHVDMMAKVDYRYLKVLQQEFSFSERLVEQSRNMEENSPLRRKYLVKALIWKSSVAIKISRAIQLVSPAKAKDWNAACKVALAELQQVEGDQEGAVTVQRLCIQSELLLLCGKNQEALLAASKCLDVANSAKNDLHCAWASLAKARILVSSCAFKDALEVLQIPMLRTEGKLDESVKLEIYQCIECLQLKLGIKLKITALEGQLNVQNSHLVPTPGMRLEKIAHLTQIVRKMKDIKNWEKVLGFATTLSEMAALEPNSWEYLVEVAEAHYHLMAYPEVAVTCSEAVAMAEANSSSLGKCMALLFRALSRMAIGEYELAELDLLGSSEAAKGDGSTADSKLRKLLTGVHHKCLNLLSLVYGGILNKEERAAECGVVADKLYPHSPQEKQKQNLTQLGQIKLDVARSLSTNNQLVKLYHSACAADSLQPCMIIERALMNVTLTKSRAIRLCVKGEPECKLTDADARVLINMIFGASTCRLYDFDGIVLEIPNNKLGNNTVKAICSKLQENPSSSVRLVGLDLSYNNLSAGSVMEMSRCGKINSQHLQMLLLRGNRRLLSSQGDIRALEQLFKTSSMAYFDCIGTMLREDGFNSILHALAGTNLKHLGIGLLKAVGQDAAKKLGDIVRSAEGLKCLEFVGIDPQYSHFILDAFSTRQGTCDIKSGPWKDPETDAQGLYFSRMCCQNYVFDEFTSASKKLVVRSDATISLLPEEDGNKCASNQTDRRTDLDATNHKPVKHIQTTLAHDQRQRVAQPRYSYIYDAELNHSTDDRALECEDFSTGPSKRTPLHRSSSFKESRKRRQQGERVKDLVSLSSISRDSDHAVCHDHEPELSMSEDSMFLRSDNSELSEHSDSSQERTRVTKRKLKIQHVDTEGKPVKRSSVGRADTSWRNALERLKSSTKEVESLLESEDHSASSTNDSGISQQCSSQQVKIVKEGSASWHMNKQGTMHSLPEVSYGKESIQVVESGDDSEVGESVSCTSDSFSPKYKTQRGRSHSKM